MINVLYISYDGMLEPLGQSQVLAYLKGLTTHCNIHLISFEKKIDWNNINERNRVALDISNAGITWYPLRYHKSPTAIATAWDILCGTLVSLWLVQRHHLKIVHARSYVPCLMALVIKKITGAKYIFDMRGFWADEKVDGGAWQQNGFLYKLVKRLERSFLLSADHIVSLTNVAVRKIKLFSYLKGRSPPFTVIPTCADLKRFSPLRRGSFCSSSSNFVLGYIGSVGSYYLFDEVVACFLKLRKLRPEATFLILNRDQHEYVLQRLSLAGVPRDVVELTNAHHDEMPHQIARMTAGIFFIKPVFSKQASAPTKLAEFLGCGVPCLGNTGVGDMASVLEGDKVGVALESFDEESITRGLERFLRVVDHSETRARCVISAQRHFSLDEGVARYQLIYDSLSD